MPEGMAAPCITESRFLLPEVRCPLQGYSESATPQKNPRENTTAMMMAKVLGCSVKAKSMAQAPGSALKKTRMIKQVITAS